MNKHGDVGFVCQRCELPIYYSEIFGWRHRWYPAPYIRALLKTKYGTACCGTDPAPALITRF